MHLEVPDQENRQDTKCPIRQAADDRVPVKRAGHSQRVNAASITRIRRVALPEVCCWPALQNEEKEGKEDVDFGDVWNDSDDGLVRTYHTDAHEKQCNTEL